MIIDMF